MRKSNCLKRVLSALLCLLMVVSCVPVNMLTVYAGGTGAQNDGLWQAYGENDTTTKGAWNTAGYGSYDALLIGYNYTGALGDAGKRMPFNGNAYTNNGVYSAKNKVGITLSNTNGHSYAFKVTDESGSNPPSETLYNPNPAITTAFDAFYMGGSNKTAPGNAELGATDTGWARIFYTFDNLDENQEYLFRMYTNNNVSGYYKAEVQDDLKIHFVEDDGTVHKNVETIQSRSFDGGVYRTYKVKGSFTIVIDRKETRIDGGSEAAKSAGYWGLSGFFFDKVVDGSEGETQAPEMWVQHGDLDTTTRGNWQTVGHYGDDLAVLFGWGAQAITDMSTGTTVGRGQERNLYIVNGVAETYNASTHGNMLNNNALCPGNFGVVNEAPYLETPAGYTGTVPTFRTYQNSSFAAVDFAAFAPYVTSVPVCSQIDDPVRMIYKSNGLDTEKTYVFTLYADSYALDDQVCFTFTTAGGATKLGSTVVNGTAFSGTGGYISFVVKGAFDLVIEFNKTFGKRFGPSAVFFDEYVAPTPDDDENDEPVVDTVPLWGQRGKIDNETAGAWETKGYGKEQAVLLGWSNATTENNGVLNQYQAYNSTVIHTPDRASITRFTAQLHLRSASTIKANIADGVPGNYMAIEATRIDGAGRKIATLDAPAGYTGVIPQYNTYAWEAWNMATSADSVVHTSIKAAAANTTYRNFLKFTGLDAEKEYTFTVYFDTDNYLSTAQPSGKVEFSFWKTDFSALLSTDYVTTTADKFQGGGYISFKVKGDFIMGIDKADRFLAPSAIFFDEYVAPAPDDDADKPTVNAWVPYGAADTATKGAWNTAGYGGYDAVLMGYGYKDALTLTSGKQVLNPNNDPNRNKFAYSAKGKVTTTGSWNEVFLYEATSTSEKNPVVETLYNPNPNAVATFDAYALGSSATTTVPNVSGLPALATEGNWCRRYFTFTGLEEGKQYVFRIYTNNNVTGYYANDTQDDLIVHFVDAQGNVHANVETIQSVSFNGGAYRAYVVEGGSFSMVIDSKNSRSTDNATGNTGATRFGLSGFFFDEYVAPAPDATEATTAATTAPTTAPVTTPTTTPTTPTTAPTTPAMPADLWKQYGSLDKNTRTKWDTVTGYGTEQAILIGWNAAAPANTVVDNLGTGGHGNWGIYARTGRGLDGASWHRNASGTFMMKQAGGEEKLLMNNEIWFYKTRDKDGELSDVGNLEIPADYTGTVPYFNAYTVHGLTDANVRYTDVLPLASGLNNRTIVSFTVPNDKANNVYYFTLYADTRNYMQEKDETISISLISYDGTQVYETVTLSTADFGRIGAYMTFKVAGNFKLVLDKPEAAKYFGFSGFFFDEDAPVVPSTPTVPDEPVAPPMPADLWSQYGNLDQNTCSKWDSVTGYGTEQAILIGWNAADSRNPAVEKLADGEQFGWGIYTRTGASLDGASWHRNTGANAITMPQVGGEEKALMNNELWFYQTRNTRNALTDTTSLEIPAEFTKTVPNFNAYTVAGLTGENVPYTNVLPLGSGMTNRTTVSFKVPKAIQYEVYYFTLYADTRNYIKEIDENITISLVSYDGKEVHKTVTLSTADFGRIGAYMTFKVAGSFKLVLDKPEAAKYFGFSGFFFDSDAPVVPTEPTEDVGPLVFPDDPDMWTVSGSVDTTTGSKWHSEGGYGDLQAILLGWTYASKENDGIAGEYKDIYKGSCYPVFRDIPRGHELLYTTDSKIVLKNTNGYPGNFWAYEGRAVIGADRLGTNLEAPEGYTGVIPQYNTYALESYGVVEPSEATIKNALLQELPATEGLNSRQYFPFSGLTETDEVTFTIYYDTRNFVDIPSGDVKFTFLSEDFSKVLGSYTANAGQFPRYGGYISFKVRGNFVLVIDKADRWLGASAFFFDPYEKPAAGSGDKEEGTADKTLWQQSGNIDGNTGGKWQTAGYGKQQAILLGWNVADTNNKKTYELKDVNATTRYNRYGINPSGSAWVRYSGADFISMVTDSAWCTNMGGDVWVYKGCNLMGIPNYKTTLETPSDFKGTVPVYNTYTGAGKNYDAEKPAPFQDVLPMSQDFGSRVAMKFILPDENVEYAFTIFADTRNYVYKVTDDVRFSFLSADGEKLLGSTVVQGSDFGKKGGYITFKVKGSFILLLDKDYYGSKNTVSSQVFGVSAFFFDEYDGPKYHSESGYAKDPIHYGNMVDTIGGVWRGRYGNVDGLLLGFNYNGTPPSDGSRFILNRDEYDLHISDVIKVTTAGDRWYSYGKSGKSVLVNPNEEQKNGLAIYSSGGTSNNSTSIVGKALYALEDGYTRNMFTFSGMPENEPYLFTLYAANDTNGWYTASKPGQIKLTFVDPEGDVIYQDKLSSAIFNKGAYVSYVVNGDFTLLIDKALNINYFGFSAFFFDEVGENFAYNLKAQAGEEKRSVLLTWKEDSPAPGSKVVIERRTADSEWVEIACLNTKVCEYLDTRRDSGETYQYRIYTRSGVKCSYISDAISYTVPSYNKTVMTLDKALYSCSSNQDTMEVTVTLKTASGVPCANVPVFLKLDFANASQVVPMVHEPEVITDENGQATFSFNPRYLGDATIYGYSRDEDTHEYSHSKSEKADVFVGETTWAKAPEIYSVTDAIMPGDVFSFSGYGMMNDTDMSKVQVVYAPNTGVAPAEKPVDGAKALPIVNVDDENGYYLMTKLPVNTAPGKYDIWVNNGYGWSEPITLNEVRPLFISEYEAWEGQTIKLSGRALQASQFGADMQTMVRLVRGDTVYYPELTKVTPYSLAFVISEGTKLGVYKVQVSNDSGASWSDLNSDQTLTVVEKGSDPLNIGVAWMDHFAWDNKYDVTDFGADGTDIKGDTVAFAAAIRTAGEAGGGVVWVPNGTYYLTILQLPANVVLMGESTENTILSYCGRNRGINMFSLTTEAKPVGHVGFANFTVTLENEAMRPDFFFWLGQGWNDGYYMEGRTASEMFMYGINLEYPNTPPKGSVRGSGCAVIGYERYIMMNCTSEGWSPLSSSMKLSQYCTLANNSFIFESGSIYASANYSFVENNYASGHMGEYEEWEYTMKRNVHGFCCQALCHTEGNVVENIGTTPLGNLRDHSNDGETYLSEVQSAMNYGDVIASSENTVTLSMISGDVAETDMNVPYNALYVVIGSGRGMGQWRKVAAIDAASRTVTIEGTWDVLPDSTSLLDFSLIADQTTFYNNEQYNAAKGVYIYGNMFDVVVSEITGHDTEGVLVVGSQTQGSTSRIWESYVVSIRDNYFTGVSPKTQRCNIALTSSREIRKGEYVAVGVNAVDIRNNTIIGVLDKNPVYEDAFGRMISRTESPIEDGIVSSVGTNANTDQVSGDITNVVIENNHLEDLQYGVTTIIHNRGLVAEGNTFTNVEENYHYGNDADHQVDPSWTTDELIITTGDITASEIKTLAESFQNVDTDHYCAESVEALNAAIGAATAITDDATQVEKNEAAYAMRMAYTDLEQHLWDAGVVTVEPTETKLGEKTYTCGSCGVTKVETVSKLVAEGSVLWIVILAVCCCAVVAVAGVTVVKAKKKKAVK